MARERSIVVRLKAEVSDFQRQMGQASRSLTDFEKAQQDMGGAASTTLGRMVQSAKINEREWTQVGRTMLGVGTAMAGMGVAALKTGIEYNSLRQKATQGLTAVTGSTEKAAAQMRRLDDYGRNSWLMRDTLIRAQTQMTGFGIETNKVIPYMSALADAVAATGGSNQDFEELARVMGQIQSQGKITARELMQFGIRGVDAAQLIGDAMGKTAGQIRSEITAGTLDAGAALDALADGMATRFEGASDLVRLSFSGAMDNLKAAWRDLSAAFASPLVDPEGGGLLVGWVNNVADALFGLQRVVEAMPQWMKTGTLAIGGMSTAVTLAGGAFMLALPKYVQLREAIGTLAAAHPRMAKFSDGLLTFGTRAVGAGAVAATAAAGFVALAKATERGGDTRGLNEMMRLVRTMTDLGSSPASAKLLDIFDELPRRFGVTAIQGRDLGDAMEKLLNPSLTDRFAESLGNLAGGFGYMSDYRKSVEELDAALVSMLDAGGVDQSAALDFIDALGLSTEELAQVFPGARDAIIGLEDAAGSAAGAAGDLADGTDAVAEAAERAQAKMDAWAGVGENVRGVFQDIASAFDAAIAKQDELGLSTAETIDEWIAGLEEQRRAAENFADNIALAYSQVANEVEGSAQDMAAAFILEMANGGEQGAAQLQMFVDGSPEQRAQLIAAWAGAGDEIARAVEEGQKPIVLDVDTSKAISDANAMMGDWDRTTTETNLSANTDPAMDLANRLMGDWENTTTDTFLSADPGPAVRVFNEETRKWENTTTDTLLSADPGKAVAVFNRETGKWERTTVRTHLGLNTGGAQATLDAWKSRNSSFTVWANVQTRGGVGSHLAPLGKYHGGKIASAPGLNAGGKVPGPRANHDNVLWPLNAGGRTLTQPLSGGEWVINSSMSARYDRELASMNAGTYPTGGSVSLSLSDADVARIAVAVREGSREGASVGTRAGFGDLASGARLSGVVV